MSLAVIVSAVIERLTFLAAATVVVVVSMAVAAVNFTPASWAPFIAAAVLAG